MKRLVDEQSAYEQGDTAVPIPTPTEPPNHAENKKSSRFEQFEDSVIDVPSDAEISEVDRYLVHVFSLSGHTDEDGK